MVKNKKTKDETRSVTLLIDGDIFAYRCAAAVEREVDWGDGIWSLFAYEHEAINSFDGLLRSVKDRIEGSNRVVFALTDSSHNWRKDILPEYKEHRTGQRKPMLLNFLKGYIRDNYETFERPSLEADDILGILGTSQSIIRGPKVIVSIDKDFYGIPGKFYRFLQSDAVVETITEYDADRYHLIQTLSGDKADGYSGCPGIGTVKASKLLDETPKKDWWSVVVKQYAKAGLSEEVALVNARVARICRNIDYDFKKKVVKLWSPKEI